MRLFTGILNKTFVSLLTAVFVRLLVYLINISNMTISGQILDDSFIIDYCYQILLSLIIWQRAT